MSTLNKRPSTEQIKRKFVLLMLLLITTESLFSQHFLSIHTGYGNKLRYEDKAAFTFSSWRSLSYGASYYYCFGNKLKFETGARFMVFGFTPTLHDVSNGSSPGSEGGHLQHGYVAVSSISML